QRPTAFAFSLYAILLANFAYVPIKRGKIHYLCTLNGVIPLLLSRLTKIENVDSEMQQSIYDKDGGNICLNHLDQQLSMIHGDLRKMQPVLGHSQFDVVTCNPPYFPTPAKTEHNHNEYVTIARHEVYCTLEEVVQACKLHVRPGGKVAMVHRPGR